LTASRYSADIDLENVNTSHALAVLGVEPGSLVLDIGTADGSVAQRLADRGCRVIGIEIDGKAAQAAERACERVIVGDVEKLDLAEALEGARFDFVLLLDVLEHLREPMKTLTAAAQRLKPGGRMIVSVPNITHAAVRLQLLSGRFQYTDSGLLDRTHLHFFDRASFEQLLAEAGAAIVDRMRTVAGLTETEIPIDPDAFRPETVAAALSDDDAETYQFVYIVAPGLAPSSPVQPSLGEALQRRAIEAERRRAEAETYVETLRTRVAALERELVERTTAEADALARAEELETQLRHRMEELERQHDELRHAKLDVAIKDEHIAVLQAELVPVRATLDQIDKMRGYIRHRVGTTTAKRFPLLHVRVSRLLNRSHDNNR
jgi:2-polyprenyl-3-methyl-5-hydroxy-6-metoxy-1,4-benzoquinol methylase